MASTKKLNKAAKPVRKSLAKPPSKVGLSSLKKRKTSKKKVTSTSKSVGRKVAFYLAISLLILSAITGFTALGYYANAWYTSRIPAVPAEILHPALASLPYVTHNEHYAPVRVTIGDMVGEEILPQTYTNGEWSIPATAAAHLVTSAYPYEPNNIIVYGHNTWTVFAKLKQVTKNEVIKITLANGTIRDYTITEMIEVTPDKIEYLQPTTTETLTIYTCVGWMDSKRLIIRAVPALPVL